MNPISIRDGYLYYGGRKTEDLENYYFVDNGNGQYAYYKLCRRITHRPCDVRGLCNHTSNSICPRRICYDYIELSDSALSAYATGIRSFDDFQRTGRQQSDKQDSPKSSTIFGEIHAMLTLAEEATKGSSEICENLKAENRAAMTKLSAAEKSLNSVMQELKEVKRELRDVQKQRDKLVGKNVILQAEIMTAKEECDSVRKELEETKSALLEASRQHAERANELREAKEAAANLRSLNEKAAKEIAELQRQNECGICFEIGGKVAFNCGHAVCGDCSNKIKACPICRAPIMLRLQLI